MIKSFSIKFFNKLSNQLINKCRLPIYTNGHPGLTPFLLGYLIVQFIYSTIAFGITFFLKSCFPTS